MGRELAQAKTERCRPDFEEMIAAARGKKAKAEALQKALYDYAGASNEGAVAEMYGALYCQIIELDKRIEQIIREQENYKE